MTTEPLVVAALGAGRMGRGIAVVFAFAGHDVVLVDAKPRDPAAFATLAADVAAEIAGTLGMMARIGLMQPDDVAPLAARVRTIPHHEAGPALAAAAIVFEGVPEVLAVKLEALAWASNLAAPDAIIASTTSTILVDELSPAVLHPGRFLNAHWLNPAFLMPLVELQAGAQTDPAVTARLTALLEAMGKVPVPCAARPGYIVPRIQMLAMNEAARMVEEGVASAADIDRAVRYGFGFRFAVLGLLEFIDWGGGDILHYASDYLTKALDHPRYEAPPVIARNMAEGRIGMKTGRGFLDYTGVDLDAYREGRLSAFADLLRGMGLARAPVL
jgi:3-hydroxybutyryl-CoA dehydrogenase